MQYKWQRRERKLSKRPMKVHGRGNFRSAEIIQEKAELARRARKERNS